MSLTTCPECDGQVSINANICPHCGNPLGGSDLSPTEHDGASGMDDERWLELFIGANWYEHYRERIEGFLLGDRAAASWNWAAFFVPGWYLYRKLYGWFFAFLALSSGFYILVSVAAVAEAPKLTLLFVAGYFAVPFLQGMFGDYLVYKRGRRVVDGARSRFDSATARRAVTNMGGTSVIALLLLLLPFGVIFIGMLAAIAIPKFVATKERAYVAFMKSELTNFLIAEESFFTDNLTYGTAREIIESGLWAPGTGVTVTTTGVGAGGYTAIAAHASIAQVCGAYIGSRSPSYPSLTEEGVVSCWSQADAATTTIVFWDGSYTIEKPASWNEMDDLSDEADVQMGNELREAYLVVLTESKSDFVDGFDLQSFSDLVRSSLTDGTDAYTETGPEVIQINGMPAIRYEIDGEIDNLRLKYWHVCIDTGEDYHQVLAWSLPSRFERNAADFAQALMSIRHAEDPAP